MAKPPAGSSLLFGALADSGHIKERKNGTYRMVLEGVDEIDWFTDRPDRFAGEWSPKKLVKKWDGLFGDVEPNAQATFEMGSKRKLVTFEMFKPKLSDSNQTLSFKVRGIGLKNKDLLTGLKNKQTSDVSLFIDESLPACLPNCEGVDLSYANLYEANLPRANLTRANLTGANLTRANLFDANLRNANLTGANLYEANLTGAYLHDANLYAAHLYGANLTGANLTYAKLINADLTGAYLHDANLYAAHLYGANLTGANLSYAKLINADLTGATYDSATTWPTADSWDNTTCPDGTNSDNNPSCGF